MANSPSAHQSKLGNYAGFVSRLSAFIVDTIITSAVIVFVTWFVSVTASMLQVRPLLTLAIETFPRIKPLIRLIVHPFSISLYAFIFVILYHVLFIFLVGQTPGKALLGLRVVPLRGGKMSLWRAILRYSGYYLSGVAFGLGFLWVVVDDRRLAWHDKLARTCVIYVWDARPDETFLSNATQKLASRRDALRAMIARRNQIRKELVSEEEDHNTLEAQEPAPRFPA